MKNIYICISLSQVRSYIPKHKSYCSLLYFLFVNVYINNHGRKSIDVLDSHVRTDTYQKKKMKSYLNLGILLFVTLNPINGSVDCPNKIKNDPRMVENSGLRKKRSDVGQNKATQNLEETKPEPALGRPIQLGSLYYAKEDRVSITENLWSTETLRSKATRVKKPSSKTQLSLTQTTNDRIKSFGMGLRLKVTVAFGFVVVDKASKSLNEKRSKHKSVSMTYSYEAINSVESISQDLRSKLDHPDICLDILGKDDGPTHVITSVTRLVFVAFISNINS